MRKVRAVFGGILVAVVAALVPLHEGHAQGATYRAVALSGQSAPGGGTFAGFGAPRINPDTNLVFPGYLQSELSVIIAGAPGSFRLVVSSNDMGSGDGFASFGNPSISTQGLVGFPVVTFGETGGESLWMETRPGVQLVKADDGGSYGGAAFRAGPLFGAKESATFQETPATLYLGTAGNMAPVLRDGDSAPGFPAGSTIDELFSFSSYDLFNEVGPTVDVNESGVLAAKVRVLPSPSPSPVPVDVIYSGKPANLGVVAQQGAVVPGLGGIIYDHLSSAPSIASNGLIAFSAMLSDRSFAVIAGTPGNLAPIVRSGSLVPTTTDVYFSFFDRAVINKTGDVIFGAGITYPNESTRYGIWIKRLTQDPVLIAISGIQLPGPDGDVDISYVEFAGPGSFNDGHQFTFLAGTGAGDAIFIADTRPGTPWLRLTNPRNRLGQVTTASVVRIAGKAMDDSGIAKVEYSVEPQGADATKKKKKRAARRKRRFRAAQGDEFWSFRVPLALGRNRITVVATDKQGHVSEPLKFTMIRYEPPVGAQKKGKGRRRR